MIKKLDDMLGFLPNYISSGIGTWDSLIINKRKPHTYRIFTQIGDYRVCLHKFDVCDETESFYHPHPWPGAFIVLSGSYLMDVGRSVDRLSAPKEVMSLKLTRNSMYEITDPLTWHKITPLEPTYTVMINGEPWDKETVAHTAVRTTKGKDLEKMSLLYTEAELVKFAQLIRNM
jgi:hypothetical protein